MSSIGSFARQTFVFAAWSVLGLLAPTCAPALAINSLPRPPTFDGVWELVNDDTGRYILLTTDQLAAGVGPGWRRTGYAFSSLSERGLAPGGQPILLPPVAVCRFYAAQTNSYFFTASA